MIVVDGRTDREKLFELLKSGGECSELDFKETLDFSKKIDEERKTKLLWILAIVGAVAAVVVAAHYIYKFFAPDYMDDFEDEFEDEFEDDFFDDEEE